jgi:glutathione synthase/RimK-type ligase-like ATP-grasp enzyme
MFESEWRRQRGAGRPGRIAIVDDDPPRQPLYPEFLLAQHLFAAHGIDAVIVDPKDLALSGRELVASGRRVDLVYNRLVDFAFGAPEHAALRDAYLGDVVVVTPGPRAHAVFADKRNLAVLGDAEWLRQAGADEDTVRLLSAAIPRTAVVAPDQGEQLWQSRKELFFKPVMGYGSKGVYRGASVTRGVFAQILSGGYVAQRYVAPSERLIEVAGEARRLKVDVRLYTYGGDVLLSAARMYRGQATNLRTPSGGFAPVYEV